jgi:hypothetical protein
MLRQRKFQKFVVIGLASAMIAPAGAAARAADEHISSAAPAAAVQDLRAPDQVAPAAQPPAQDMRAPDQVAPAAQPQGKTANVLVPPVQAAQDLRAPDQVAPAATNSKHPTGVASNAAPTWPVHPQTLTPPKASSDDGIDTGWFVGLGGLALVAIMGTGSFFLIRARSPKRAHA